jgi:pilus assembly protein CpaF
MTPLTGPLHELLVDDAVSDVLVNGAGPAWVDRGRGVERTDVSFRDEQDVRRVAQRLAAAAGVRLDDACPYADAVLPDGTRLHAVLPPVAGQGTTLSLRVPPRRAFSLTGLVERHAVHAHAADLLRRMVRRRLAFVVTGGTGSGKTTVLSALLSEADPGERLVLVEDTPELRPALDHVVRLQMRQANAEGAGAVPMSTLVRQALRMRPDRLVVGEVRGAEVVDLLAAMNTGHDGGATTLHANRAEHVPARFEALCATAGLSRAASHSQLAAAVQAVVHLSRGADGLRRVAGSAVTCVTEDGHVRVVPAYGFHSGQTLPGAGAERFDNLLDVR